LHSTVIVLCPQGVEQGQRPALRKGSRMKPHLRTLYVAMALAIAPAAAVQAQVNFGISIGVPGVQIGINTPYYPELVQVPGYPVYYAPQASANIFFYDGLYWVYAHDDWYASTWYNGPWQLTPREYVPLYVLRVPVRYYRQPPVYFSGWYLDAPPRWGHHWGHDWERRRAGWDRWDRRHVPRPAPLPAYQQRYSGDRYPGAIEQQRAIRAEHDRYRPREQFNRQIMERSAPTGHPEAHRHEPRGDDRGERRGDDRGDGRVHGRNDDRTGGRGDWRQDGRSEHRLRSSWRHPRRQHRPRHPSHRVYCNPLGRMNRHSSRRARTAPNRNNPTRRSPWRRDPPFSAASRAGRGVRTGDGATTSAGRTVGSHQTDF
jgi:hypothetical protein